MNKPLLIVIAGLVVVVLAILLNFPEDSEDEVNAPPPAAEEQTASTPQSETQGDSSQAEQIPPPVNPSFDVVRVNPDGDVVVAGRAAPNASVTVLDGDSPLGKIQADNRGEWVFLPGQPLEPGNREFSLEAIDTYGRLTRSDDVVILAVPERGQTLAGAQGDNTSALAVAVPRGQAGQARVLQSPGLEQVDPQTARLSIEAVNYDQEGRLTISGYAPPEAPLRAYLDNSPIGGGTAGEDAVWVIKPNQNVAPGIYTLRIDQLDAQGSVIARASTPFSRAEALSSLPAGGIIVIQPGDNLWQIARRTYKSGFDYTVIFDANKDQIRDPDVIFPGQIFTLPER